MSRLCVIGNSHVGSLKKAWVEHLRERKDVQPTFFASRGWLMAQMYPMKGKLVCKSAELRKMLEFTSGGKDEVVASDYDEFLIYGVNAKPHFSPPSGTCSRAVINRAIEDSIVNTLSYYLLRQLRTLTDKPIYIGHCPLWAAVSVKSNPHPAAYIEGVSMANRIFYCRQGAELVPQPLETIVNGDATDPKFLRGATRLAVGDALDDLAQPETDRSHMNAEFGRLWWSKFFATRAPAEDST